MPELSDYHPRRDPHREPYDPKRKWRFRPVGQLVPAPLPGLPIPKTYAAWPVWRDSTTSQVKFQPLPKKQAVQLYHKARRFERQTRQPGRQDGALGRNGLAVLHALIFDILNYATGRLDPSYARIAEKACISLRSVARGLANLKAAGVLNWLRRCAESWRDGRFCLGQETNAYAVLPATQWRGYYEPPEAPAPQPGTWGDHPPRDIMAEAVADCAAGSTKAAIAALGAADKYGGDALAGALARLGSAFFRLNP